ncbi:uncharacterized protein LOC135811972 isoform X4 [Sycon ciliatum]|uniref:uncharacterized protein LOC135811972 isoform X4 n=1 Tax=Sycon ciliatum TaxID=27933 RepID=UPI0031F6F125
MACSGLCLGVLIGCLLLFCPLLLTGCNGQHVSLNAAGTRQSTTAFRVTFGDGQPTANVTSYLPACVVISGSGPFIRLEKTDGSLVLAETGAFSGGTIVQVNATVHPILDTSYTGLYHCRTVDNNSTQTYQLNIVELCPDLIFAKHNFKPITDFSRAIGTNISVQCQTGFLANTSLDVTYSTCQSGGVWNPRPPACESCRVRCSDDINVESCNHVMGQGTVNCICKLNYIWAGSKCVVSPTIPVTSVVSPTSPVTSVVSSTSHDTSEVSPTSHDTSAMSSGTRSLHPPSTADDSTKQRVSTAAIVGIASVVSIVTVACAILLTFKIKKVHRTLPVDSPVTVPMDILPPNTTEEEGGDDQQAAAQPDTTTTTLAVSQRVPQRSTTKCKVARPFVVVAPAKKSHVYSIEEVSSSGEIELLT